MPLWDKGAPVDEAFLTFSAGNEFELDQRLVPFDCQASAAHARMLGAAGHITEEEASQLVEGLDTIRDLHSRGEFTIAREQEDCHTAIEEWPRRSARRASRSTWVARATIRS